MTHKIKIHYSLSDAGLRNYYLAGNKQEKTQSAEIETEDASIISLAELVDNDHLEITDSLNHQVSQHTLSFQKINSTGYGWGLEELLSDSSSRTIDEMTDVKIKADIVHQKIDQILSETEILDILRKEIPSEAIQTEYETYKKICEQNIVDLADKNKKQQIEIEKQKTINRKKAAELLNRIDRWVDKHGSETCVLRKKHGYDYKDLARQEYCDAIEYSKLEKIKYDSKIFEYTSISKPRIEILKHIEEIKKNKYVTAVDTEIWTKNSDYDDYYNDEESETIEIIEVKYDILEESVFRHYVVS